MTGEYVRSFLYRMTQKIKDKWIPIVISLLLVLLCTLISIIRPKPFEKSLDLLENLTYDFQVRSNPKPLSPSNAISIVDIDDKSLELEGRWPWPRKKIAELAAKLYEAGAVVVAFDATFPDPEENIITQAVDELTKGGKTRSEVLEELERVRTSFDYDRMFAKSLALGESLLGIVFSDQSEHAGTLPPPFLTISTQLQEQLHIPDKMGYLGNIPVLQQAAKNGGFINANKDPDGVLRSSNLLIRRGDDVYAALSLQAASLYLLADKIDLVTEHYGDHIVLEGIKLDQLVIPTDEEGKILIPFRGPAFTFPYVSATDVLQGKVQSSLIEGKLIFIGFSAAALADLYSTSADPVLPGVEVHATIASGIIDQYLPYKPTWAMGVVTCMLAIFGIICSILLPLLGAAASTIFTGALTAGILSFDNWMWTSYGIVLAVLFPIALIWILFIFNMAWGYFVETRRGRELKAVFGQYVPPAYLEEMTKKGMEINLDGESKELSVLFSDIRNFTHLSENMNASELKQFLNRFFSPITEVIFNHKGTIDKYVGDMVMAFWGAPLEDTEHSYQAVSTALEMQERLGFLNQEFLQEGRPAIRIGIGVNTGLMNVGDMGSKFRRSYTVIGDAVNLASRLEGQGKYYHIDVMVGESTWEQTKDQFIYKKIDKIKVKGKDKSVEVFQPICTIQEATPELEQELAIHHQALEAYRLQDWRRATKLFEQLIVSFPHQAGLCEVFLERIAFLRLQPYKDDWDGSFTSLEK